MENYKLLGGIKQCHRNAYTQHKGECWMDAILALFTYTDERNIGEMVQDKLVTWYKDLTNINKNISEYITTLIEKKQNGIPLNFDIYNSRDREFFIINCTEFLKHMTIRFNRRIQLEIDFPIKRQQSIETEALSLTYYGNIILNYNRKEHLKKHIYDLGEHQLGGTTLDEIYICQLLLYLLTKYEYLNANILIIDSVVKVYSVLEEAKHIMENETIPKEKQETELLNLLKVPDINFILKKLETLQQYLVNIMEILKSSFGFLFTYTNHTMSIFKCQRIGDIEKEHMKFFDDNEDPTIEEIPYDTIFGFVAIKIPKERYGVNEKMICFNLCDTYEDYIKYNFEFLFYMFLYYNINRKEKVEEDKITNLKQKVFETVKLDTYSKFFKGLIINTMIKYNAFDELFVILNMSEKININIKDKYLNYTPLDLLFGYRSNIGLEKLKILLKRFIELGVEDTGIKENLENFEREEYKRLGIKTHSGGSKKEYNTKISYRFITELFI